MSSILKVDTIQDQSGNNIINENADTITIPSGATIDTSVATLTLPTTIEVDAIEPQSGTSLTIGASGDTITIPSGATITNSGTATGFGGGSLIKLSTNSSLSGVASVDFDNTVVTTTYKKYFIIFNGVEIVTDNQNFQMKLSNDNGSSFISSVSNHIIRTSNTSTDTIGINRNTGLNYTQLTTQNIGNGGNEGISGYMVLELTAGKPPRGTFQCTHQNTNTYFHTAGFYIDANTTVNYIRFEVSSGNFQNGTITLYGMDQ